MKKVMEVKIGTARQGALEGSGKTGDACPELGRGGASDILEGERLLSIRQLSVILAVSIRTIYRLVARGDLAPPIEVGSSQRFLATDVTAYLERLKRRRNRAAWIEEAK